MRCLVFALIIIAAFTAVLSYPQMETYGCSGRGGKCYTSADCCYPLVCHTYLAKCVSRFYKISESDRKSAENQSGYLNNQISPE
ncbi:uncharacterized protein LOC143422912 [Xylocopa sonorina]|uniref:uncharacterized protein LOC143422912 n=1 Tax=Xylocopa sonorina TaxID=1818115 RepID=UPI00403B31A4